jgi:glycosyltransferase involved in cell wall biosynthesis
VRVLLVNAFHYPRGGVERAYFDETRLLTEAGHEVGHFAIQDPRNLPSPTRQWFAPHADYSEGAGLAGRIAQLPRALWSFPAAQAMRRLLGAWRPDVAHVHAPSRYLTPAPTRELERAGIPVVMTLHDFKPWCTNRTLFAHGAPCERCRGGHHFQALRTACVQDSRAASAVGAAEAYLHDRLGVYRTVRRWIAPSTFVRDKAVELGLDPARAIVIPHALTDRRAPAPAAAPPALPAAPFVLYAGRLSVEKGVRLLPAIALRLAPTPVVVAGDGPLMPWLEEQRAGLTNLVLLGHLEQAALATTLARATIAVVPSLSYETFCFAAAEALLAGRRVVASRIGAIPELVEHQVTGLLAPAGDAHALAEACERALNDPDASHWAAAGRERVRAITDPARHAAALIEVLESVRARG